MFLYNAFLWLSSHTHTGSFSPSLFLISSFECHYGLFRHCAKGLERILFILIQHNSNMHSSSSRKRPGHSSAGWINTRDGAAGSSTSTVQSKGLLRVLEADVLQRESALLRSGDRVQGAMLGLLWRTFGRKRMALVQASACHLIRQPSVWLFCLHQACTDAPRTALVWHLDLQIRGHFEGLYPVWCTARNQYTIWSSPSAIAVIPNTTIVSPSLTISRL